MSTIAEKLKITYLGLAGLTTSIRQLLSVGAKEVTSQEILEEVKAGGGSVYPTIQMTETTAALDANKVYIWGEVASLDITLNAGEEGVANVYFLEFYSGATATTITFPASVTEVRGIVGNNMIINVAIFNGVAYIA